LPRLVFAAHAHQVAAAVRAHQRVASWP
jgi:hypothetical protein